MKKNSLLKELSLMAIILSVLLFVAGCTKTPPAPTPVAPSLTVTFPQGTIPYGDSVSFSWEAEGKVSYVSLDGKEVAPIGSYQTKRLFDSVNTYKLTATGPGGSASKTIAIKVGDWTTSDYGIISHDYWIFGSLSQKSITTNNQWHVFSKDNTAPGFYTEAYYFLPEGVWQTRDRATDKIKDSGRWKIKEDSLVYEGGSRALILQATKDTLSTEVSNYSKNLDGTRDLVYTRLIYVRDTTK